METIGYNASTYKIDWKTSLSVVVLSAVIKKNFHYIEKCVVTQTIVKVILKETEGLRSNIYYFQIIIAKMHKNQ